MSRAPTASPGDSERSAGVRATSAVRPTCVEPTRLWSYGPGVDDDDPAEGALKGTASVSENPDRVEYSETMRVAGQATSVRVQCECGGQLGSLNLPYASREQSFHAQCPECGTRYQRLLTELFSHTKTGRDVLVILPRARPRG